jgi:hypothetical protein
MPGLIFLDTRAWTSLPKFDHFQARAKNNHGLNIRTVNKEMV